MAEKIECKGSCLCGAVKVTIQVKEKTVGACHCSMCRKWGGGPFLSIEVGHEVHFEGSEHITVFNSSNWAERGFCAKCGTHLFYRLKQGGFHAVPFGLFETDKSWVFDHQIFIDEKPAVYAFANQTKNLTGEEVFAKFN